MLCRSANVVDNRSQGDPLLMNLRKSVQSWWSGAGRSYLFAGIFSECRFLSSWLVFLSIASVGSLVSLRYAGSSRATPCHSATPHNLGPLTLSPPTTTSAFGTALHPLPTSQLVPSVPSPADFPYKYHRSRVFLSYSWPGCGHPALAI